jgi:hypothetical protein
MVGAFLVLAGMDEGLRILLRVAFMWWLSEALPIVLLLSFLLALLRPLALHRAQVRTKSPTPVPLLELFVVSAIEAGILCTLASVAYCVVWFLGSSSSLLIWSVRC